MTSGPKVRLGTKRPSITSHWIRSTPASSSAATSWPSREKSAGSTDGTISIRRSDPGWSVIGPILADPYPRSVEPTVIEITTVAAGGDGLGRDEAGRVVFVPGTLPEEAVSVELVLEKKDFARGRLLEVVRASADRLEPPCPFVAAGCGGCDWQHAAPRAQRRLKAAVVADALRRQAHLEVVVDEGPVLSVTGYRTTLGGVAVRGRFGLRRRSSHEVVDIGPCLVAHPLVDELVVDGRFPDGEVVLRAAPGTGERLVIVDGPPAATTVPAGVRVTSSAELSAGRRAWIHDELAGHRWRISARSFFQARADGAEALVDAVRRAATRPGLPAATSSTCMGGSASSPRRSQGRSGHGRGALRVVGGRPR